MLLALLNAQIELTLRDFIVKVSCFCEISIPQNPDKLGESIFCFVILFNVDHNTKVAHIYLHILHIYFSYIADSFSSIFFLTVNFTVKLME